MQDAISQSTNGEMDSPNLLDCYRIALDFGMPAALRAYERLTLESTPNSVDLNTHSVKDVLLD